MRTRCLLRRCWWHGRQLQSVRCGRPAASCPGEGPCLKRPDARSPPDRGPAQHGGHNAPYPAAVLVQAVETDGYDRGCSYGYYGWLRPSGGVQQSRSRPRGMKCGLHGGWTIGGDGALLDQDCSGGYLQPVSVCKGVCWGKRCPTPSGQGPPGRWREGTGLGTLRRTIRGGPRGHPSQERRTAENYNF